MRQYLIIIILFFSSCINPYDDKQKVDKNHIDYIDIRKWSDTVSLRLTSDQADNFINHWNNSNVKEGLYKFLPDYFFTIHLKGDSIISYKTSGDLIKQKSDLPYSIGDKSYFKTIWFDQAGLTDEYFEYYPVYFVNDDFITDTNLLDEKHRNAIKEVLTYYNYKWCDIRGQIFYKGRIDVELLWNYTTKANDSVWLSSHR